MNAIARPSRPDFCFSAAVLSGVDAADVYTALTGYEIDDEDLFDADEDVEIIAVQYVDAPVSESTAVCGVR